MLTGAHLRRSQALRLPVDFPASSASFAAPRTFRPTLFAPAASSTEPPSCCALAPHLGFALCDALSRLTRAPFCHALACLPGCCPPSALSRFIWAPFIHALACLLGCCLSSTLSRFFQTFECFALTLHSNFASCLRFHASLRPLHLRFHASSRLPLVALSRFFGVGPRFAFASHEATHSPRSHVVFGSS